MVRGNLELEMRLIEDLLDLTRIARGQLTLQLRQADAHELLQSALEIVRCESNNDISRLSLLSRHPNTS